MAAILTERGHGDAVPSLLRAVQAESYRSHDATALKAAHRTANDQTVVWLAAPAGEDVPGGVPDTVLADCADDWMDIFREAGTLEPTDPPMPIIGWLTEMAASLLLPPSAQGQAETPRQADDGGMAWWD